MKAKFVTFNKKRYNIPFTKADENGNIVVNRSISFTPGGKHLGKITPAYYETENKEEIDYLRAYPGNGKDFKEYEPKQTAKAAPKPEPKKSKPAPEPEEEEDIQFYGSNGSKEEQVFESVTTAQQAAIQLRKLDGNIKVSEVNSKDKALAKAEEMGVSFPNLK